MFSFRGQETVGLIKAKIRIKEKTDDKQRLTYAMMEF